jgi:hypothetical protein
MRTLSILLLLLSTQAVGQNLKCRWITPSAGFVSLDTAIIEPGSVTVNSSLSFEYQSTTQMIQVGGSSDSVLVCYRTLSPVALSPIYRRDIAQYEASRLEDDDIRANSFVSPPTGFNSNVQKSGFISRGVTFGNRQSLFVNSMLNLQIQGQVSDNMFIDAVITDQNIPYQPEGNTQQIRDFDNVYIKLYNDDFDLTVGDVVLSQPFERGYFLKYYKNVQGLQLNYRSDQGKWKRHTHVAASAAKGKFASTVVEARDGSQGPYVLRGPNNERFIVILANSERVFLDGRQLQRGFDQDYTIDYNLGQITFSSNILITQFSIIRVDFEYAEQYYARTAMSAGQRLSNSNWDIRVNYYSEKDNQAGTLGFQPGEQDLDVLRQIGDDISLAQITGIDSIGFNPNQILYKKLDTLDLDGVMQEIFKYSSDPDSAFFVVNFNEVGFGNGDYVLLQSTANGRVYQWISPQGGLSQGNYQPTVQVPLPIAKRMMTVGVDYRFNKYEQLSQELAVSTIDQNLYSSIDDNDNSGLAWMGAFSSKGRKLSNDYEFRSEVKWEVDQSTFNPIDRYRPILFDRDWDYTPDGTGAADMMIWLSAGLYKSASQSINYQVLRRDRTDVINGWQHQATINQRMGNFYLLSEHFLLDNLQGELRSDWVRTREDLSFRKGLIVPGYVFSLDQNRLSMGDSVISSRMYFLANEWYITNADTSQVKFRLSYQKRQDQLPVQGVLENYTQADNYTAQFSKTFTNHQVGIAGTYRKVDDQLNSLTDEWLNARADWSGRLIKTYLKHRLTYQVGSVREQKRDFIYVEVGGNQGTHAWRDENGDNIKDLNEFYEAVNPDERQFAKFFTPTDEFVNAFENRYQHVIDGEFPRVWTEHGGIPKFLSKWSGQASFNAHYKTTSDQAADRFNPWQLDARSDDVIYTSNRWRYLLYYNRSRAGFGWEGSYSLAERKQLLTNGFELGEHRDWTSSLNWRLNQTYTFRFKNQWGIQLNESDFLQNRNLNIISYGLGPEFVWQPQNSLRLIVEYNYRRKVNNQEGTVGQASDVSEWHGNVTWSQGAKGSLNVDVRFLEISFNGEGNTFAAYQLLEALQPGQNATWRLNWQQVVGKGVHMTLQYNGRKSEGIQPIHTGTVMMTAYF